jgi:hypothetical protein
LVLPIDGKVISIEAFLLTGLPLMIPAGWTHQVNLVIPLALNQEFCVNIARVYQYAQLARVPYGQVRHEWLPSLRHLRQEVTHASSPKGERESSLRGP